MIAIVIGVVYLLIACVFAYKHLSWVRECDEQLNLHFFEPSLVFRVCVLSLVWPIVMLVGLVVWIIIKINNIEDYE